MSGAVKAGEAYVQLIIRGQAEVKRGLDEVKEKIDATGKAQGMGGLGGAAMKLNAVLGILGKAFKVVSETLKAFIGAVAAPIKLLRSLAEQIDKVAKAARRMGSTVEFVSQMKYGAELAGASMERFEMAMKAWGRNLQSFRLGVGEAKATLEDLGFAAADFSGKTMEEQLMMIADRMSEAGREGEMAGIAMRLFGEDGVSILPMLSNGAEGLRALQKEAEMLGLTLTGETGIAAEELQDQIKRVQYWFEGMRNLVFSVVTPIVSGFIDDLIPALMVIRQTVVAMGTAFAAAFQGAYAGGMDLSGIIVKVSQAILGLTSIVLSMMAGLTDSLALFMRGIAWALDQIGMGTQSTGLANFVGTLDAASKGMMDASNIAWDAAGGFDDAYRSASQMWDDNRTHLDRFNNVSSDWAEDVSKAAKIIEGTFSGDAIRRNASGMSKLQEMTNKILERQLQALKRVEGEIQRVALGVGTLGTNIGVM